MRSTLDGAGLSRLSALSALFALAAIGTMLYLVILELTSILALALSVAVGAIGLMLEALNGRARSRRVALSALWPEVIDSIISSISSGASIVESVIELSEVGPIQLRSRFQGFRSDLERGHNLAASLQRLKSQFGDAHADRLLELLALVDQAGGAGLVESLRSQVLLTRQELAFHGEVSSKLGWITGTAKLAVGAPWLIVAMLATRPENAAAYAALEGSMILLIGLAVSVFAFRLVQMLGALPTGPRVFA